MSFMQRIPFVVRCCAAVSAMNFLPATVSAAILNVTVKVENLAPANSVSFAPLHVGFHNGTFDSFDSGQAATAPIVSVAEGGSGSAWFPAFAAADPGAGLGTVMGALFPGTSAMNTFMVDTNVNPFFSFATMVIPSNDFFLGNDSPTQYRLFDAGGNLLISSIDQSASQIWDAGSEAFDPAHAAFVVGGNNDLRTPQNGVVSFGFAELSGFNGFSTAAGYVFDSQLTSSTPVYRISFTTAPVPEPSSFVLGGVGFAGIATFRFMQRRRRPKSE